MRKGEFSLEDFLKQLGARKSWFARKLEEMLPGGADVLKGVKRQTGKEFKRMEGIVCA